MPETQEPQEGGQGDGGQPDVQAGGQGGEGAPNGDPSKSSAGTPDDGGKPNPGAESITAERLTAVLDARQRKSDAAFKKLQEEQSANSETMAKMATSLELLANPKKEPKAQPDGEPVKESEEVVQLRRKVDELERRGRESDERATSEASKRRDYQFETDVKQALNKAGCLDMEAAFLVIKPRLNQSEDGATIFATVKTQFGEEDLTLDEYISREFSEEVAPYMFKGKMRSGGPAGGDAGSGGQGSHTFTREQLLDNPDLYAKDPEKARAALEAGRVKGVPRPGQALSSFQGRG